MSQFFFWKRFFGRISETEYSFVARSKAGPRKYYVSPRASPINGGSLYFANDILEISSYSIALFLLTFPESRSDRNTYSIRAARLHLFCYSKGILVLYFITSPWPPIDTNPFTSLTPMERQMCKNPIYYR